MIVNLLTEHHLEFLSLKGGCRGSSESTLVKMSNCWKSHATAQMICVNDVQITNHLEILLPVATTGQYKSISQSDHLVRWGWGGSKVL